MPDQHGLSRRRVLTLGAASLTCLLALPRTLAARRLPGPFEEEDDDNLLVLVQLAGGNDGLSTVVPFRDDAYLAARTTTCIDPATVLRLDDDRGLNPDLPRLHAAYGRGELAIVEGCGYPQPNRSHFKAMEIWGTASEAGKSAGDGWVSRLVTTAYGAERLATRVVHVGAQLPDPLISTDHPVLCFESPVAYRLAAGEAPLDAVLEESSAGAAGSVRSRLRAMLDDARSSSDAVRAAAARYRPSLEYPASPLGKALQTTAALITARIGCRILSVTLTGFDTHANQLVQHQDMLQQLDGALGAFLEDVRATERGKQVLVLVYSEFGRRVAENASGGTDHGAAAPMFLAGLPVQGGLYGRHPSLTELDDGDLIHTTDFRSVYGTVIRDWFGIEPSRVLRADYPVLPLLKV